MTVPLSRAMHSITPPPKFPTSPISSSRWKRGLPVSIRYSSTKPINGEMILSSQQPLSPSMQAAQSASRRDQEQAQQASHMEDVSPDVGGDADTSLSSTLQQMELGSDALVMRFTPTVHKEAQHEVCAVMGSEQPPQLHATGFRSPDISSEDEHSEETKIRHSWATEETSTAENRSPSHDSTTMGLDGDSDYLSSQRSQTEKNDATGQIVEERDGEAEQDEAVEEHTNLDYQIPEDVLRAAMQASPNTRASFWSSKMYRGPEGQSLSTHYCRTFEVAERVAQYFLNEKVVGFDIEWKPGAWSNSIKMNASLIQLACEDRIALFHISLFEGTKPEELMPPTLKIVLENPDILKVGVAVKSDFSRLQKYLNIQAQGVFELSRLHNLVELYATAPDKVNNKLVGLAAQVYQHLQLPLYKGAPLDGESKHTASVRESDWSRPLDLQQIHYAASDAYAGFRLYHMLEWKRKQLRPIPQTRGICDYDAKPKLRDSTKKKMTRKAKDACTVAPEQSTSAPEEELDDAEEEDAYETAPEEPEDLAEASTEQSAVLDDSINIRAQKRVGQVNRSWLRGPDPGYPVLPREAEEDTSPSGSSPILKDCTRPTEDAVDSAFAPNTRPPCSEADEADDKFADPDLEKTLQMMDLDAEGKLTESTSSTQKATQSASDHKFLRSTKTNHVADSKNTTTDVEMSGYSPIDLEAKEPTTAATPTFQPLPDPTNEALHLPQYTRATQWAEQYLHSTIPSPTSTVPSRIRATIPHLRAYHLWHTQRLSIDDIASHLRDPPLSHSTVTGYIMQAVTLERLEYDKETVRELMMSLPVGMKKGRWKWMAEKVGALK